ncbi:MAG: hypothetical protein WCG05_05040 [Alphaproteobacteria bacterium]
MATGCFAQYPQQLETLKKAFSQNTPHHGWILSGPRGVGKGAFAEGFAVRLLQENLAIPDDTEYHIEQNAHPNFLRITPSTDAVQSTITVDQVRSLKAFAQKTTADGSWKVIVINSLNDLGINASNALLKILEEPQPKTIFFLIFHSGSPLLPTLRSRCTVLSFHPQISAEQNSGSLAHAIAKNRSGLLSLLETPEIQTLTDQLLDILKTPKIDYGKVYALVNSIQKAPEKFHVFSEIVLWSLNQIIQAKTQPESPFAGLFQGWNAVPLAQILKIQSDLMHLLNQQKTLNLDRRHTLLGAFFSMSSLKTL